MDAAFQTSSDAPTDLVRTASDHKSIGQWARETRLGNAIAGLAISSALFAGCAGESGSRDGAIKNQTPSSEAGDISDRPTTTAVLDTPTTDTPTTDTPTTDTPTTEAVTTTDAPEDPLVAATASATQLFEFWTEHIDSPADFQNDSRIKDLLHPAVWSRLVSEMNANETNGYAYVADPRDELSFSASPASAGAVSVDVCVHQFGTTTQNGVAVDGPRERFDSFNLLMAKDGDTWKAGLINYAGEVPAC